MFCFKMSMNRLIKRIERSDDYEVNEIIKALSRRQKRVDPNYEMVVLSLPRYNLKARCQQIEWMAEALKKYVEVKEETA